MILVRSDEEEEEEEQIKLKQSEEWKEYQEQRTNL